MTVATVPSVVHIYQTERGHRLAAAEWPKSLMISNVVATTASYTRFRWPYIRFEVENGCAIYRVDTCDRGAWLGVLVESWAAPL